MSTSPAVSGPAFVVPEGFEVLEGYDYETSHKYLYAWPIGVPGHWDTGIDWKAVLASINPDLVAEIDRLVKKANNIEVPDQPVRLVPHLALDPELWAPDCPTDGHGEDLEVEEVEEPPPFTSCQPY